MLNWTAERGKSCTPGDAFQGIKQKSVLKVHAYIIHYWTHPTGREFKIVRPTQKTRKNGLKKGSRILKVVRGRFALQVWRDLSPNPEGQEGENSLPA